MHRVLGYWPTPSEVEYLICFELPGREWYDGHERDRIQDCSYYYREARRYRTSAMVDCGMEGP